MQTAQATVGAANDIVLENFPDNLIEIMTVGVPVDVWVWSGPDGYDRDSHVLWEAERHEHDVQDYKPHSIFQKVNIVLGVRSRVVGGDWQATTKRILDVLGQQARSRVARWTRAL